MSTEATSAGSATGASANAPNPTASPADKGKGKFVQEHVADDEEEDDEDEEDEDEEMEEDDEEDDLDAIDPSVIIGTRRTRGVRVDYTSAAALEKAGLKPEDADDDEGEDSFVAKDTDMQED
ncbi:hypothetical protein DAEQUDRAFT_723906 [Daedalea quercina L-15889]|uniref:Histone chaperone domain-containing protein n=1 Tax=Daedalea quercina L-15889 TaxID=1314783 RepID=A0A165SCY3_9APHY|nr:hypothetical protein DAEQUDRAFT_723906 [Daedalea quercina L-15889]